MEAFLCDHQTHFSRGRGRCLVCGWYAGLFTMRCSLCQHGLCRCCDGDTLEYQRARIKSMHPWLEGEFFGLEALYREV